MARKRSRRKRPQRSSRPRRRSSWRKTVVSIGFLAVLVLIYWLLPGSYQGITGIPRYIADGDSFTLCDGDECTRIRLCGVNAPEHGDPGGKESRTALRKLIGEAEVYCIPMGDGTPCDGLGTHKSHGRTIAQCYVGKVDLAEAQVRKGHACDLPRFSDGYYGAIKGACSE